MASGQPGTRVSRRRAQGPQAPPSRLALLGLPEDLVDLRDLAQQLVRLGHVHAALGARGAGQLGGLVEQLVQVRVLLEVRRLEVVRPQHHRWCLTSSERCSLMKMARALNSGSWLAAYFSAMALTDSAS